jgi:hypothetical protein
MTQLVRDQVSRDVVDTAQQLLEAAQSGQIVGIVFGVALRGRKYFVNVSGSFSRDPTFARGVVAALDDELMSMVQGRADSSTTI